MVSPLIPRWLLSEGGYRFPQALLPDSSFSDPPFEPMDQKCSFADSTAPPGPLQFPRTLPSSDVALQALGSSPDPPSPRSPSAPPVKMFLLFNLCSFLGLGSPRIHRVTPLLISPSCSPMIGSPRLLIAPFYSLNCSEGEKEY